MLFDTITTVNSVSKYRSLEKRLSSFGRDISNYKNRPLSDIDYMIKITEGKLENIVNDTAFNSYAQNEDYVKETLTLQAFKAIKDIKEGNERSEVLIPGYTYYDCKITGNLVSGKKCFFIKESKAQWIKVRQDVRVLKAMELLEHGTDEDFKKIYFELADGMPFKSASKMCMEHITKSSNKSLSEMAAYCDTRWSGKWPWQVKASRKLTSKIMENQKMVRNSLRTFRDEFNKTRRRINEGEIEKSEIILKFKGLADDITGMIEKLGKTSGALITDTRDQVRTEFGDQHLSALETISKETITHAVDALSELKGAIEKQVDDMANNSGDVRPAFDDPMAPPAPGGDQGPGEFDDAPEGDPNMQGGDDMDMGDGEEDPDMEGGDDMDADFDLDAELNLGDERKKK